MGDKRLAPDRASVEALITCCGLRFTALVSFGGFYLKPKPGGQQLNSTNQRSMKLQHRVMQEWASLILGQKLARWQDHPTVNQHNITSHMSHGLVAFATGLHGPWTRARSSYRRSGQSQIPELGHGVGAAGRVSAADLAKDSKPLIRNPGSRHLVTSSKGPKLAASRPGSCTSPQ